MPDKYRRLLAESAKPNPKEKRLDTSSIESDISWADRSDIAENSSEDDYEKIPNINIDEMPFAEVIHHLDEWLIAKTGIEDLADELGDLTPWTTEAARQQQESSDED